MHLISRNKSKPLEWIIKSAFILLFSLALYFQIFRRDDFPQLWTEFANSLAGPAAWLLIPVFLLMPVNWLVESAKWKLILGKDIKIRFSRAVKAILTGVSFSLFTPNRVGEYFGRIAHVEAKDNWTAALSTLIGSFSQNLINFMAGLLAFFLLLISGLSASTILFWGLLIALVMIAVLMLYLYFHLEILVSALKAVKLRWIKPRWLEKIEYLSTVDDNRLHGALALSAIRYTLFASQYVILLHLLGVDLAWWELYMGVAIIYFFHTMVPLPPFIDQLVRGQMALFIWAGQGTNELSVLSAGFFIWIINVVVPALLGVLFLSNVQVLKSYGYEKQTPPTPPTSDRDLDGVTPIQ